MQVYEHRRSTQTGWSGRGRTNIILNTDFLEFNPLLADFILRVSLRVAKLIWPFAVRIWRMHVPNF